MRWMLLVGVMLAGAAFCRLADSYRGVEYNTAAAQREALGKAWEEGYRAGWTGERAEWVDNLNRKLMAGELVMHDEQGREIQRID